jgi:hypothetical protein
MAATIAAWAVLIVVDGAVTIFTVAMIVMGWKPARAEFQRIRAAWRECFRPRQQMPTTVPAANGTAWIPVPRSVFEAIAEGERALAAGERIVTLDEVLAEAGAQQEGGA